MTCMGKAKLVLKQKLVFNVGAIVEQTIWQLPVRTIKRAHGLKYSLFYGYDGQRIIGYDNEHGKGDHRHYREHEEPYSFTTVEQLMADFSNDIKKERGDHEK